MEEWRSVVGFESYEVSNLGSVRRNNKILKGGLHKKGYRLYMLFKNGIYDHRTGHSLVAEAFIGKRPFGLVIDHIDNNKNNNRVENLRYITQSFNTRRGESFKKNPMRCIRKYGNRYELRIKDFGYHTYNTLEEAILTRDAVLDSLASQEVQSYQ
jgi:hypothetical protein